MSFDLKLENGDLVLSAGSLVPVFNEEKLAQDILKAIFTPTGSNRLHSWYGSPLQDRVAGSVLDTELTGSVINNAIIYALRNLQMLQQMQEQDGQFLTPREQISSIQDVSVFIDQNDPRKMNILISVITKSGDRVEEGFTINI